MKIASWNVNSLRVRLPHVLDWISTHQPDVLSLQETKTTDDKFPADEIREAGFEVSYAGQKTYNGVAIISKSKASDIVTDVPDLEDPQRRILCATINGVRVLNLYVVNGQEVGAEKYEWKLHWLEKVSDFIEKEMRQHQQFVVMGDFNIAPEDRDTYDPTIWKDRILCSQLERDALQRILDFGLSDTFRLFDQEEGSFSWWDYRAAAFRRDMGLRIDLVLSSAAMTEVCTAGYIDKEPRKLERPSDHTPVIAEFNC